MDPRLVFKQQYVWIWGDDFFVTPKPSHINHNNVFSQFQTLRPVIPTPFLLSPTLRPIIPTTLLVIPTPLLVIPTKVGIHALMN